MSADLILAKKKYKNFAIVTDGLWRKSLSVIRSLGKAGYHVTVLGDSYCTTGFWSRYTSNRVVGPTASQNINAFGTCLTQLLEQFKLAEIKPVVFPMEDASMHWLVNNWNNNPNPGYLALIPPPPALDVAADKALTMEHAKKLGIDHPGTWLANSAEEIINLTQPFSEGSFVVKPRVGVGSSGVVYGQKRSKQEWADHIERFGALIVQERISAEGAALGASLIMDKAGNLIAGVAHRRLQQYPVSGGPSTDRETIDAPELIERSRKLLESLNWTGVAMVEWKLDPKDGKEKLLEINPRFWGSLELAVRAGVNFPLLYAEASEGKLACKLPTGPFYGTSGVRCRWMIPGEILRYLTQDKAQRESLLKFI